MTAVAPGSLSRAMNDRLWTIAQHKYGWGCYGYRDWPSFDALARLGLVELFRGDRHERRYSLTAKGLAECARRFPVSPAVLGTYEPQPGGRTPRDGIGGCDVAPRVFVAGDGA